MHVNTSIEAVQYSTAQKCTVQNSDPYRMLYCTVQYSRLIALQYRRLQYSTVNGTVNA